MKEMEAEREKYIIRGNYYRDQSHQQDSDIMPLSLIQDVRIRTDLTPGC
jgi:hypothetical protein